jgi:hypothetical protein
MTDDFHFDYPYSSKTAVKSDDLESCKRNDARAKKPIPEFYINDEYYHKSGSGFKVTKNAFKITRD